jgi:hypothetical protein
MNPLEWKEPAETRSAKPWNAASPLKAGSQGTTGQEQVTRRAARQRQIELAERRAERMDF